MLKEQFYEYVVINLECFWVRLELFSVFLLIYNLTFTCSKSTIEIGKKYDEGVRCVIRCMIDKGVKYVQN